MRELMACKDMPWEYISPSRGKGMDWVAAGDIRNAGGADKGAYRRTVVLVFLNSKVKLIINRKGGITLRKHRGNEHHSVAIGEAHMKSSETQLHEDELGAGPQASVEDAQPASSGERPA